jgi:hypothetical protein
MESIDSPATGIKMSIGYLITSEGARTSLRGVALRTPLLIRDAFRRIPYPPS